jgi:hypothetical protein
MITITLMLDPEQDPILLSDPELLKQIPVVSDPGRPRSGTTTLLMPYINLIYGKGGGGSRLKENRRKR